MQNENITKFIDQLKNNWQLLAFGVFFLGYITFAFYMQINGFSFVVPDLIFLTAFGLLILIISLPLLILLQFNHINRYLLVAISGIPIIFFQNFTIAIILAIFIGINHGNYLLKITSNTNQDQKDSKAVQYIDYLIFFSGFILLLYVDWRYTFIYVINVAFYNSIIDYYEEEKLFNPFQIIMYFLSMSFAIALLIDAKGFTLANMQKVNVHCQLENNQSIQGTLVFDDKENFYIKDGNQSISISKEKIIDKVQYIKDPLQSKSLIDIFKENYYLSPMSKLLK